jgi:hypothetical protein
MCWLGSVFVKMQEKSRSFTTREAQRLVAL